LKRGLPGVTIWFRQRWLDTSVRRKGLVVVVIPLVAVAAVVVVSLPLQRQERDHRAAATHDTALVTAVQDILTIAVNAETGVRGYALTDDPVFLGPYHESVASLPDVLPALTTTALVAHEQTAGDDIQTTATQMFAVLAQLEQFAARGALSPELGDELRLAKSVMDRLRSQVTVVTGRGRALVLHQRAEINRIETEREAVAIAALLLGLFGMISGVLLFTSGISQRLSAAVRNA
jgi:CHASE3 domain sensor protein